MVHKFLPNYRKWFDYEKSSAFCVRLQKALFPSLCQTLGKSPGFSVYIEEEVKWKKN